MKEILSSCFLAFFLLASFNAAQTQTPTPATIKASIAGTVVRAGTGQPLKNVRVSLRRANSAGPAIARGGIDPRIAEAISNAAANIATVLTDDMGRFLFIGMEAGNYYVSAERDGYIAWEYGQRSYSGKGVAINVAPAQQVTNIDLSVPQASIVSGRVLGQDGEPAAQASVEAFAYQYADGKRTLAQVASAQTNDLGEYRLFWLQPGDYFLAVMNRNPPGMPTGQVDVSQNQNNDPARNLQLIQAAVGVTLGTRGAAPIVDALMPEALALYYYPGTLDPEAAVPVRVTAAAEIRGLDFVLRPATSVTVSGRIAAPFNLAAPTAPRGARGQRQGALAENLRGLIQGRQGAQVSLSRIGSSRSGLLPGLGFTEAVGPDGGFQFRNVQPGPYYIYASTVGPDGQQYSGRSRIDVVNADVTNATVQVRANSELRGRILLESQQPQSFRVETLGIQLVPEEISGTAPALVTALAGRGLANLPTPTPSVAQIAADGTFVLTGVGSSEYRVKVIGLPNGAYIESGRLGSLDALSRPVAIADSRELLEIQIGFTPGKVTGSVVDTVRRPLSGITAVLVPDEARRGRSELYFTATTDASGQFNFTTVPAGSYKLFAWEDVPSGAWQYGDFIRRYEDRGVSVSVSRGGTSSLEARVIPAGE